MRAESLRRAVSQTRVETQALMNAARSQCVAQQLQLHSTHYLTSPKLPCRTEPKEKGRNGSPSTTNEQGFIFDITRRPLFHICRQQNVSK